MFCSSVKVNDSQVEENVAQTVAGITGWGRDACGGGRGQGANKAHVGFSLTRLYYSGKLSQSFHPLLP